MITKSAINCFKFCNPHFSPIILSGESIEDIIRGVGQKSATDHKRPPIPESMPAALSELMQGEKWNVSIVKRVDFAYSAW